MKHSSGAMTLASRNRPATTHYADALPHAEFSDTANANASASACVLRGVVLAVGVLLLVVPIVLLTTGCSVDVIAADLSIPGVFLTNRWRHI